MSNMEDVKRQFASLVLQLKSYERAVSPKLSSVKSHREQIMALANPVSSMLSLGIRHIRDIMNGLKSINQLIEDERLKLRL